ncbi:hypothetical protein [Lysinibacillus sphaericus]|uniref:hypothetical protein n=1 Tax=Lysinibacillus sphaericus TaxID=1421 RepID=UPI0018CE53CD|nr:hypothetical protein [Lysinibacillus sphaericus]
MFVAGFLFNRRAIATERVLLGYVVLMDQDDNIEFEPFIQQLSGFMNLIPFIKLAIEGVFLYLL